MNHINNDAEHVLIRKSRNNLIVVGTGIVLFSIWTVIKTMGSIILLRDETVAAIRDMADTGTYALSYNAVLAVIIVSGALASAVILLINLYVGASAIAEGRGKRKSIVYLLLAGLMIILTIISIGANVAHIDAVEQRGAYTRDTSLSAIIIDITSIIMLIDMITASVRIRKLTGAAKHAKETHAKE